LAPIFSSSVIQASPLLKAGLEVESILNMGANEGPADHRAKLFANALAQTRALMVGKSTEAVHAEMLAKGASEAEAARLAPHRTFPGDRASTMIGMQALTPESLGALIAFYEHRTFTQAVLSGINAQEPSTKQQKKMSTRNNTHSISRFPLLTIREFAELNKIDIDEMEDMVAAGTFDTVYIQGMCRMIRPAYSNTLSVSAVAQLLRISERAVHVEMEAGRLKFERGHNNEIRIRKPDLEALLNRLSS
jgi:hypothetical protein